MTERKSKIVDPVGSATIRSNGTGEVTVPRNGGGSAPRKSNPASVEMATRSMPQDVGAEAAVSQWTVNCAKPKTDVILSGTSKQLKKLVAKLRMQGWALDKEKHTEYQALADEIAEAIRGNE